MTQTEREVARIQEVYRGYREDSAKQRDWSLDNPGNRAILTERETQLRALLDTHHRLPLSTQEILDVGCGRGEQLAQLRDWGADPPRLHGIDLMGDRVALARAALPGVDLREASAASLPEPDATYDLVLLFTVMSSILDPGAQDAVARETARVLKPGGAVVWYDFRLNNPRNPHVRGVSEARIASLFPRFDPDLRSVTLLPPLARRLGGWTDRAYPRLARIGWLRTHLLGCLTKPSA